MEPGMRTKIKNYQLALMAILFLALIQFGPYKDGTYKGTSRSFYTTEDYYGHSLIKVKNGGITYVSFIIRDSANHETFDEKYEKHFTGNDVYVQQCRNDWIGVQSYTDSLIKYQDPDKIDAITGATWSCNLFRASVKEALLQAKSQD
jgi:major membrane immunogen (membrane-anchored lipoprotein)